MGACFPPCTYSPSSSHILHPHTITHTVRNTNRHSHTTHLQAVGDIPCAWPRASSDIRMLPNAFLVLLCIESVLGLDPRLDWYEENSSRGLLRKSGRRTDYLMVNKKVQSCCPPLCCHLGICLWPHPPVHPSLALQLLSIQLWFQLSGDTLFPYYPTQHDNFLIDKLKGIQGGYVSKHGQREESESLLLCPQSVP